MIELVTSETAIASGIVAIPVALLILALWRGRRTPAPTRKPAERRKRKPRHHTSASSSAQRDVASARAARVNDADRVRQRQADRGLSAPAAPVTAAVPAGGTVATPAAHDSSPETVRLQASIRVMNDELDRLRSLHSQVADETEHGKLRALELELEEASRWIASLLDDRARQTATEQKLRKQLRLLNDALDRAHSERDVARSHTDTLQAELVQTQHDVSRLRGMLERSEGARRTLEGELASLAREMVRLISQISELAADREVLRREFGANRQLLQAHNLAEQTATRALQDARIRGEVIDLNAIETDLRRLGRLRQERTDSMDALTLRLASNDFDSGSVQQQFVDAQERANELDDELRGAEQGITDIGRALTNVKRKVRRLEQADADIITLN